MAPDDPRLSDLESRLEAVEDRFPPFVGGNVRQKHLHPDIVARNVSGVPTVINPEGTLVWDKTNDRMYVNNDGSVAYTLIGPGGDDDALFSQTASVTVANTITETTLVGAGQGTVTLPANGFAVGRVLRVRAWGYYGTGGAGTMRLRLKLGAVTVGNTGAVSPSANATNQTWFVDAIITCRTAGATGTAFCQGVARFHFGNTTEVRLLMTNTATSTVDTTGTLLIDLTATWGTAAAANTITCTNLLAELLDVSGSGIGSGAGAHDAVTLAASADTLLGLAAQVLSLDAQAANSVFAGPASGGLAIPTFRALVKADLPATITEAYISFGATLEGLSVQP